MLYHQSKQEKHSERTTALSKMKDKYDYSGLEYPVSFDGIRRFEEINKVSIYVYEVDEETNDINECKKGNTQYINNVIYLLLIEQDENSIMLYKRYWEIIKFTPSYTR